MGGTKRKSVSKKLLACQGFTKHRMLARPAEAKGKQVGVPGTHWAGDSAEEQDKTYLCTVIDYHALHKWDAKEGRAPGQAFEMVELGVDGKSGTGAKFFLAYPSPFLDYYYLQFPQEAEAPAAEEGAEAAVDVDAMDVDKVVTHENPDTLKSDLLAFNGRFCTQLGPAKLLLEGRSKGRYTRLFKCGVKGCPGKFTIYGSSAGIVNRHYTQFALQGVADLREEHSQMLDELNAVSCRKEPPPPSPPATNVTMHRRTGRR